MTGRKRQIFMRTAMKGESPEDVAASLAVSRAVEFQTAEVLSVCKEHREEKQLKAASVNETAVDAAFEPVRAQGFMIETDEGVFHAKAVVAAMGAVHAKLGIPGEEEMAGRGVSYCATCDGAFFRGKVTAVIGGGDVAVEDAIFLARGCEKVYLIHRRDELRAAKILQEEVMSLPNVEIIWDTVAEKIEGNGQVEGISLKNVKTGDKMELPVDGVFVAVGILPDSEILKEIVNCDPKGYVLAGEEVQQRYLCEIYKVCKYVKEALLCKVGGWSGFVAHW